MSEVLTAIALVIVIEGFILAASPSTCKRAAMQFATLPESAIRYAGLVCMVLGAIALYLVT